MTCALYKINNYYKFLFIRYKRCVFPKGRGQVECPIAQNVEIQDHGAVNTLTACDVAVDVGCAGYQ